VWFGPGEALALRIDDYEGTQLRIDEAIKERQRGEDRIGTTKTDESDSYVPVPLSPKLQNGLLFIRIVATRALD
jgi:hypothetical protein